MINFNTWGAGEQRHPEPRHGGTFIRSLGDTAAYLTRRSLGSTPSESVEFSETALMAPLQLQIQLLEFLVYTVL